MDKTLIDRVVTELNSALAETRLRSITQVGKFAYIITFEGETLRRLLISIDPRDPRIYLVRRRDRDLKKLSAHRSLFAIAAERSLAGMMFVSAETMPSERIVELTFGSENPAKLVVQLTGTSSNLFVLNAIDSIVAADRSSDAGQSVGTIYVLPAERSEGIRSLPPLPISQDGESISEELDLYFSKKDTETEVQRLADAARAKCRQQIKKAEKLIANLENDLVVHGDAGRWKRYGDLLLASQTTASRLPGRIEVVDIFEETQPTISIEADESDTIPETAQKYFRRYTKARNAKDEVQARIEKAKSDLDSLKNVESEIQTAIEQKDTEYFKGLTASKRQLPSSSKPKTKEEKQLAGIRTYISSDGFEILVGKKSTDNDFLTQRVAHSRDTWMHAADYPGSHVVVRNANRKEIPRSTLFEAAQLAAFFSQGNKQTKAAVNYTEKKFVSKPKGAAPGLVRLASFKTILVEPVFPTVEKKS